LFGAGLLVSAGLTVSAGLIQDTELIATGGFLAAFLLINYN